MTTRTGEHLGFVRGMPTQGMFGCLRTPLKSALRRKSLSLGLTALVLFANPAHAQDPAVLARQNNCLACHHQSLRVVGPSWQEVAAKAAPHAQQALAARIAGGGVGAWGTWPMPSNPQLTPEQALQLAQWVLQEGAR